VVADDQMEISSTTNAEGDQSVPRDQLFRPIFIQVAVIFNPIRENNLFTKRRESNLYPARNA
jgi:hypothetical protein